MTLSILIPAYCYPEGIRRILDNLSGRMSTEVEVVIFDNSKDDSVHKVVSAFQDAGMRVTYQKHLPSGKPSENWNALLDFAKGEYCLLMHHDEFPLDKDFLSCTLDMLHNDSLTDVFMLDCFLVDGIHGLIRRHVPNAIRAWAVQQNPAYLFRRNVIGPVSTLIVRRSLFPRFDTALTWLIDVDAYFRLRGTTSRWRLCQQIRIGSIIDRGHSITAGISHSLGDIRKKEQAYLLDRHPAAARWLRSDRHSVSRLIEMALWVMMRGTTRVRDLFFPASGFNQVPQKTFNTLMNR